MEEEEKSTTLREQKSPESEETTNPEEIEEDKKIRRKRRPKTEIEGRNFFCKCGKSYLSQAALTLHVKTKHNGLEPEEISKEILSRKGKSKSKTEKRKSLNSEKKLEVPVEKKKDEEKGFTEIEACSRLGIGKPTEYEALDTLSKFVKILKKDLTPPYSQILIHMQKAYRKEHDDLIQNIQIEKSCQRIFAEFLLYLSSTVNQKFFLWAVIYSKNYINCLNISGYELHKGTSEYKTDDRSLEYTLSHDASRVPELCNEFLLCYLPKQCSAFSRELAIETTTLLCAWLYKQKYTILRILPM